MSAEVEELIRTNGHAPIVYVAHAISGPIDEGYRVYREHKDRVNAIAVECARMGYAPIVPILLTNEFGSVGWEHAMAVDYSFVKVADVLYVHQSNWESKGATLEAEWARSLGKPVYTELEQLSRWIRNRPTVH